MLSRKDIRIKEKKIIEKILMKKIKNTLSPIKKRKISEEIKAINNFMVEKV